MNIDQVTHANTIKKWLRATDGTEPSNHRVKAIVKLTPIEAKLKLRLEADAHRPKRDRRTALMLFEGKRSSNPSLFSEGRAG
ncbi:MAG: hypothetical protein M3A44_13740 [Gammaproteobacteria bacterium]